MDIVQALDLTLCFVQQNTMGEFWGGVAGGVG